MFSVRINSIEIVLIIDGKEDLMAKNFDENDDEMYVTLELDDGQEVECVVITILEANGRDYIVLLPDDTADTEEGEVFLYRYKEDKEGNPDLENIESDEEFEIVSDAFDEWLDSQEYDEIVGEDEE